MERVKKFVTSVAPPAFVCAILGLLIFVNGRLEKDAANYERELKREREAAYAERNRLGQEIDTLTAERDLYASRLESHEPSDPPALAEKQVVDLPDDAANWYATLFLADDWEKRPNQAAADKMWRTAQWCQDLQKTAHGREMRISAPEARRYWPHVRATPCLILQDPKGLVVYSEVNADLAKRPRQLMRSINLTMKKRRNCPDKFCPFIPPDQADQEEEPQDLSAHPVVNPGPADVPKKKSIVPALLIGGAAFGLTYALKFGGAVRRA